MPYVLQIKPKHSNRLGKDSYGRASCVAKSLGCRECKAIRPTQMLKYTKPQGWHSKCLTFFCRPWDQEAGMWLTAFVCRIILQWLVRQVIYPRCKGWVKVLGSWWVESQLGRNHKSHSWRGWSLQCSRWSGNGKEALESRNKNWDATKIRKVLHHQVIE